jgi:hypothetical protein
MFKVYHIGTYYYVTQDVPLFAFGSHNKLRYRIVIDGKIFGTSERYMLSDDIIEKNNTIYDAQRCNCIDSMKPKEHDNITKHMLAHIKKIECMYNNLIDKYNDSTGHIKQFEYDDYYSAVQFKFRDASDKKLMYHILCACIRAGIVLTYNRMMYVGKRKMCAVSNGDMTYKSSLGEDLCGFYASKDGSCSQVHTKHLRQNNSAHDSKTGQ